MTDPWINAFLDHQEDYEEDRRDLERERQPSQIAGRPVG